MEAAQKATHTRVGYISIFLSLYFMFFYFFFWFVMFAMVGLYKLVGHVGCGFRFSISLLRPLQIAVTRPISLVAVVPATETEEKAPTKPPSLAVGLSNCPDDFFSLFFSSSSSSFFYLASTFPFDCSSPPISWFFIAFIYVHMLLLLTLRCLVLEQYDSIRYHLISLLENMNVSTF